MATLCVDIAASDIMALLMKMLQRIAEVIYGMVEYPSHRREHDLGSIPSEYLSLDLCMMH